MLEVLPVVHLSAKLSLTRQMLDSRLIHQRQRHRESQWARLAGGAAGEACRIPERQSRMVGRRPSQSRCPFRAGFRQRRKGRATMTTRFLVASVVTLFYSLVKQRAIRFISILYKDILA